MKRLAQHSWGPASHTLPTLLRPLGALLLGFCLSAQAGVYQFQFSDLAANNNGNVPDGRAGGWTDSRIISSPGGTITDVSVKLNVAGGYNGDLYAYLSYNGALVPLLNRVGVSSSTPFGYSDSGLSITLSDAGTLGDIHRYQQVAGYNSQITGGGNWTPDGRLLDPLSAASKFDSTDGRVGFNVFDGMDPNGKWTLFLADLSGGGSSRVVSWELNITAVPEPTNVALGVFLGIGAVVSLCRSPRLRRFLRARC